MKKLYWKCLMKFYRYKWGRIMEMYTYMYLDNDYATNQQIEALERQINYYWTLDCYYEHKLEQRK